MTITTTKANGQHTAVATCAAGQCCATCKSERHAKTQAQTGAQQMLAQAGLPAEAVLPFAAPPVRKPAKNPAPVFSSGPHRLSSPVRLSHLVRSFGTATAAR